MGKKALEISDVRGKTVYLYCFQAWCPGCHSHGFPTMREVREHFKGDQDVVFLAIQTVFEGYGTNTMTNGLRALKKFDLDIPLGLSGAEAKPSKLMRSYRTRGTPWTIIIGSDGKVLTDGFRVGAEEAIALIEKSKKARRER
jgi:thiol-disulfide isomerase/thioredoxin